MAPVFLGVFDVSRWLRLFMTVPLNHCFKLMTEYDRRNCAIPLLDINVARRD
jgi:hypothetical protein